MTRVEIVADVPGDPGRLIRSGELRSIDREPRGAGLVHGDFLAFGVDLLQSERCLVESFGGGEIPHRNGRDRLSVS